MNDPITVGIIGLIVVLFLFLTGIELGFAMVIMGLPASHTSSPWMPHSTCSRRTCTIVLNTYSFTVIPLFVLMGQVAFNSGIAKRLFDAAHKFIGHIPGGLAMATVGGRHGLQGHMLLFARHVSNLRQRRRA
jgi:TRAP-type mannitol/chloroaromatic compound transport system permease large subunit